MRPWLNKSNRSLARYLLNMRFLLGSNRRGSSTFSVVHCGGDVEFTDGEVEHGD